MSGPAEIEGSAVYSISGIATVVDSNSEKGERD